MHHEDVRRAQPDWQPREISPELADVLWSRLGMARLMLRKAPVGVELVRADDPAHRERPRPDHGQGADAGGYGDRHARGTHHVDDGPDQRCGRSPGRQRLRRGRPSGCQLAVVIRYDRVAR